MLSKKLMLLGGIMLTITSIFAETRRFMVVQKTNGTADTLWLNRVEDISIESLEDSIDGQLYVDMGLSVYWSACNLGATYPGERGSYFAWGETETKSYFSSTTYTISNPYLEGVYQDAVAATWGGDWVAATGKQYLELIDNSTLKIVNYNVKGKTQLVYLLTSKINGNKLILPISGYLDGSTQKEKTSAFYWLSDEPSVFSIESSERSIQGLLEERGANVRGVIKKQ